MTSSSVGESLAAAQEARAAGLFRHTPLLRSAPLSALFDDKKDVYIKLDALQDSGSFKDRGMAHLCYILKTQQNVQTLISSSGGNAGLAVATVARKFGDLNVQVIVPKTTKEMVIQKLQSLGADVTVHGENWNAADELARERVKEYGSEAAYVSPYDNPLLWTGHSSLVDEIVDDLERLTSEPTIGAVIVSVGGGGLLCGTLEGLARRGLSSQTTVVASETEGASSFGQAWKTGELVRLNSIDSIATSLGALQVTPVALERGKQHAGGLREAICTDAEAVDACVKFAQDHRLLVEPACGAALAVVYSERLRNQLLKDIKGPIVVEVCGGSGVNLELLSKWKADFNL